MNNDHEELEARIAAYIDGELAPADAARLEVFLANTDPKLAEQVIGMIGDKHRLRSLPRARAPEDLAPRILEQVERATLLNNVDQFSAHHRPWWQSKAAVAAALFLVFGGFAYFILQALRTTNPVWQAVVEPSAQHVESATEAAAKAMPATPSETLAMQAKSPAPAGAENASTFSASAAPATLPSMPMGSLDQAAPAHEQPVVLALVAQDPDDFSRLHQMIDGFRAANSLNGQALAGAARRAVLKDAANAPASQPAGDAAAATPPPAAATQRAAGSAVLVTYHITLRADQIEQLTRQFQVDAPPPSTPAFNDQQNEEKSPAADVPIAYIITMTLPPATAPSATQP